MAEFQPFLMERFMSRFEQAVDYNLSESGVHAMRLDELLAGDEERRRRLLETSLNYPHVNGNPELRRLIAGLYDGAGERNVLVTVGAIEANYIAVRTLLSPGDEIALMLPNYMQVWGVAKNHDLVIRPFRLREERRWTLDLDELEAAVTPATRLVAVCNPNNPTGHILTEDEMGAIAAAAERAGAWIIADEVYRGAERDRDEETPSFYGRYDRVIAVGSMSKAYGLPGLRLGWMVAPEDVVDEAWARHEYVAISATALSNELAALALSPETRPRIIERTRGLIRGGYPLIEDWTRAERELVALVPPQASAVAFLRYQLDLDSTTLVERLRAEKGVLVIPGDHFGMGRFVRVNFGLPREHVEPALRRIGDLLHELRS